VGRSVGHAICRIDEWGSSTQMPPDDKMAPRWRSRDGGVGEKGSTLKRHGRLRRLREQPRYGAGFAVADPASRNVETSYVPLLARKEHR